MRSCEAGACSIICTRRGAGCGCISWGDTHEECVCMCYGGGGGGGSNSPQIVKGGKKIPFKRFKPRIKVTSETKFSICTHNLPIGALALILDKYFPNKIVVPAAKATDEVTFSLKNKTFKQIITASGLVLSFPLPPLGKRKKEKEN